MFTEGCLALVEGDYTEDATLLVIAIGHPPCESREAARSIFGHIDFLGKGATTLLEDVGHSHMTVYGEAEHLAETICAKGAN